MVVLPSSDRAMRILVAGAAGFIGSHVCERLIADGHAVWGLDNFDDFYEIGIKRRNISGILSHRRMRLVEGDIRDAVLLDGLFRSVPFDLVIHLAARPGVRPSIAQPGLCYDVNVTGTLRLLEAMKVHRVSRLVFASSSSVYGESDGLPFSEDRTAVEPLSPYAASKRSGELLCQSWHHAYGLSVCCLRFFTVYGPRQRPDLVIGSFLQLMRNGRTVPVHGDGSAGRDFTHVSDVVEAISRSGQLLRSLPPTEPTFRILNVGHGRTVTLNELVHELEKSLGLKARVSRRSGRVGEVGITLADTAGLEQALGFRPETSFSDGISGYVAWLDDVRSGVAETAPAGAR